MSGNRVGQSAETARASTWLDNWNARHLERYTDQVEKGLHDVGCEQRERSSLCHCSKRRREREGRTELPTLTFYGPTCDGCNREAEFDGDGFSCPRCAASWDRHATDGDKADRFDDDHGPGPFGGEQFGRRLLEVVNPPAKTTEARSAGRWCATCQRHGSHHTDRHDEMTGDDRG